MNWKITLLSLCIYLFCHSLMGQDLSIRFKAGLGFSQFLGDSEMVNGEEVESFGFTNGFHLGLGLGIPFSDRFGARAMILYSQRGIAYEYEGPSYFIFDGPNNGLLPSLGGTRNMSLEVTNSYIEIPLTAYAKLGRVEFEGGAYAAFLVSSRGDGELIFSNPSANVEPITISLDHDYYGDSFDRASNAETISRVINGVPGTVPQTIGAYYESIDNDERLYNLFDFGLTANVAFYLNAGLYISAGLDYGLVDVTNNEQDLSISELDENRAFITREDVDHNLTVKASIGFSF